MNTYNLKTILVVAILAVLVLLLKTLFGNITKRDTSIDKKRRDQLKFNSKRTSSQDMSTAELIDLVTKPARNYIMPSMEVNDNKFKKLDILE